MTQQTCLKALNVLMLFDVITMDKLWILVLWVMTQCILDLGYQPLEVNWDGSAFWVDYNLSYRKLGNTMEAETIPP
jgi:hypothetical protein